MYSSQSLKDSFGGKEAQLSWMDKNDKKYTYHLWTKKSPRHLLITLHSSPLVDDDELREVFCNWGIVKHITHKGHDFAPYIVTLGEFSYNYTKVWNLRTFLGVHLTFWWTVWKTILEGKSMYVLSAVLNILSQKAMQNRCWKKASRNPTITRRRKLHKNNNKQYRNNQTSGLKQTENTLQQLIHNKNLTIQFPDVIGKPWKATLNKIQNQTTYPQQKTKWKGGGKLSHFRHAFSIATGEFPLSPCILTRVIPETPITVIGETPISQMDREGNNAAIPATKCNTKPMEKNKKKVGTQSRTTKLINPLPLRNPPMKFW